MLMNVAKSCLERERPNIGGVRSLITSSTRGTISPRGHLDLGYHITGDLISPRGTVSTPSRTPYHIPGNLLP